MRELDPVERRRVARLLALAERARPLAPPGAPPFLAHARVRTAAGAERDLLFGTRTAVGGGLALLDWRTAPLSEALLGADEGEGYQVEVEGRAVEGTLLERNLATFEAGALVRVETPGAALVRGAEAWHAERRAAAALAPRPAALRGRPAGPAALTLDRAQEALVALPARRSLLVLGEAGCGKTTVALHRAAALVRRAQAEGRRLRAAVVVPTEGLRALAQALLRRLGAAEVEVWRLDRLAAALAVRTFPDLPRREGTGASAAVVRLKRHPALRAALAELAPRPAALPDDAPRRLARALACAGDLHALFGDARLMGLVRAAAGGELPAHAVAETLEHARVQASPTAEEELAAVLPEARRTVDGRALDAGTPMEDAGTVDPEDHAVLLELERLRALARGKRPRALGAFDHLVVDEAQELAPLELALVGRCLAPGGSITVAGDADQQVDPAAGFAGWPATLRELGAEGATAARLEVSYRCPPAVVALARGLRGEAPGPAGLLAPDPAVLGYLSHPGELHAVTWLLEALPDLRARDPGASLAVVCRTAETARRLGRALALGTEARLALDGRFVFAPGVQVTAVDEVRGLEFDHVVLPDADATGYPATATARHALYVAATRARHQLVLAGVGPASPWLHALPAPASRAPGTPGRGDPEGPRGPGAAR